MRSRSLRRRLKCSPIIRRRSLSSATSDLPAKEAETALRLFTESVASLDRAVAAGTEGYLYSLRRSATWATL